MSEPIFVGCDPEAFFMDGTEVIPATVLVPTPIETPYGMVSHDGIAVEFNPWPTVHPEELVERLQSLVRFAKKEFGYDINFTPVIDVSEKCIEDGGKADDSALQFGCSPDINVWNPDDHSIRGDASQCLQRFGGGHFHINLPDDFGDLEKVEMVRHLERTVGLCINAASTQDVEAHRRKFYGKSGACRVKIYGIEWRTPSSAVFKDGNFLSRIMAFIQKAVVTEDMHYLASDEEVVDTINGGKVREEAWELL